MAQPNWMSAPVVTPQTIEAPPSGTPRWMSAPIVGAPGVPDLPTGAATMGAPTQAPDFEPGQRDMGGLSAPPMAATAAPVDPQQGRGNVTLPTVTVTPEPARVMTDTGFESDPTWIGNAKRLYQETEGKPFEGEDAAAADWLKNYVAQTKWNMGGAATTIRDAMTKLSPEGKAALLQSIDEYSKAPTSGESVIRGLKGVATDPTTYATGGLGALITKTVGKKAAESAVRKALQEGIKKQMLSTGTKQAAGVGAGYGVTGSALEQGVQVAADGQEAIDPTQLATAAAGGAVLGAGANKIIDKARGLTAVRNLAKEAGSEADLLTNAEIIQKVTREANAPARENMGGNQLLQRKEVNARVTGDIIREAKDIIKTLPNNSPNKQALLDAANRGVNNSQRELDELTQIPGGPALIEVLVKAVRADRLTAPSPSSQNFLLRGARTASDLLLPGVLSRPINYMLSPRSSSEQVVDKLLNKYGGAAEKIGSLGIPSPAASSIQDLRSMAAQEATDVAARRTAAAQEKSAQVLARQAQERASRNSVLEATGMPLGGSFQELLQGGRSGLNLTSDQAIDALRIISQKNRDNPVGAAADQVRRSSPKGVTDPNAFYGIQNEIRKLQERGVLGGQPGALSTPTQGSGIRNPISYAANVRNAEGALKLAQDSAPNNALAQFASVVARIKEPSAKAALIQQRLLKATDQAEIDYLTNFVEPLTRFGAKSK